MRRQIAKLNHRLMAVELENQQQQQRETVKINTVSSIKTRNILLSSNSMVLIVPPSKYSFDLFCVKKNRFLPSNQTPTERFGTVHHDIVL